jgi:hypothetical protein
MEGSAAVGFPIPYYHWVTSSPPPYDTNFNIVFLILDVIIYLVLAMLISFIILKFKK